MLKKHRPNGHDKLVVSLSCPNCQSEHTRWIGFIITKKYGKRHRRQCADCATTFYLDIDGQVNKKLLTIRRQKDSTDE